MAAAISIAAMTVGELLGADAGSHAQTKIVDLVSDSRDVMEGSAFVALSGAHAHGLDFAEQAYSNGAAIILYEPDADARALEGPALAVPDLRARLGELAQRFYAREATWPRLIAITGTNGKTTVAYLIAQALSQAQRTCGYIGTLGFGIPPLLVEHRLTTPDCLTLHKEIALMPVGDVALEVSSHALVQNRIDGLSIRAAVFTNLTRDHLDAHGDLAAYARAKASLFIRPEIDHVVLNLDDPFSEQLRSEIDPAVRILGVSVARNDRADLFAAVDESSLNGLELAISGAYGRAKITSALIGDLNAQNLLLALGALLNLDVPLSEACDALAGSIPPPGRMESFRGRPDDPLVIVDYAHTPDALARTLEAVRGLADGQIWCVFGCGGDRDAGKRALMGQAAASYADHIVVTNDNPRSEDPQLIAAAIVDGVGQHPSVRVQLEREAAILAAIADGRRGDVVLVAGKGHEHTQLVGTQTLLHDDRAVVRDALGLAA